jgi:hypothetical protein
VEPMWLAPLIWQLTKLNVFTTRNQPTYIVCKLEREDKQYGIIFLLQANHIVVA